ncbi:hypothetical protein [Vibrio coralliilyticus]|uniref:hypothetical protein n=1 Tax=Vibrio coralliilyticus TaxID=190893 RepID=UPI000C167631|nr:hypothetical protein [Vibrio coralliilyticus]
MNKDVGTNENTDFPWSSYDKNSTKRKNTVSSIVVNDYCKAVLDELCKRTDVTQRKRLIRIVENGLIQAAQEIEAKKL